MNASTPVRRIVVLGALGQLGSELCRQLGERAIPVTRRECDILQREDIFDTICRLRPNAVINAAAYTKVDQAETEPDVCRLVNALAVREIALACKRLDCPLVQISTDYVFGQIKTTRAPYDENDIPGPVNVYGESKLEGERFATGHNRHFIVRTCGLYASPYARSAHKNFVASMVRLAKECSLIKVVNDQICTPSYVPQIAQAIVFLLTTEAYGTYHVTERGATTWFEFAREIAKTLALPVDIQPISSAEYPSIATRPVYSVLNCGKYTSLNGPIMAHWRDALAECLTRAS